MTPVFARVCWVAAFAGLAACATPVAPASFRGGTFVYKPAGGVELKLDVHRPASPDRLPVLVWIHGGALIMGGRANPPPRLATLARRGDLALVSLDYRLAPAVRLPEIVDDLRDAFRWIRAEGPAAAGLDPDRIAVAGQSAGGYLTLMSGFCLDTPPAALVSFWGYGDIAGDWYTRPSEHYRSTAPNLTQEQGERAKAEAAAAAVMTGAETGAHREARWDWYLWLRQNGMWTREVAGLDPIAEADALARFCPARNVTTAYPPTMLIHGTADTDVPCEESRAMAAALERAGVEHEMIVVERGGHGLAGVSAARVAEIETRAVEFLRERLAVGDERR